MLRKIINQDGPHWKTKKQGPKNVQNGSKKEKKLKKKRKMRKKLREMAPKMRLQVMRDWKQSVKSSFTFTLANKAYDIV